MKHLLTVLLFFIFQLTSFAQTQFQVSGTLTDSNWLPIANSIVEIRGTSPCNDSIFVSTLTDGFGLYDVTVQAVCDTGTMWVIPIDCDAGTNVYSWGANTPSFTVDFICSACQLSVQIAVDSTNIPTTFTATVAGGGTPPYSYFWSDNTFSQTTGVVFPDEYCVTVTDANGCGTVACENYLGNTGPCIDPDLINPDIGCTADYDPVCGCDGVVYSNSCVAENWFGVTSWISGACQGNCEVQIEVLPVVNTTDAYLLKSTAFGVAPFTYLWSTGETAADITVEQTGSYCITVTDADGCESDLCEWVNIIPSNPCLDIELIDWTASCTADINPVCGCDEVTYQNACIAEKYYGVTDWQAGACNGTIDTSGVCTTEFIYTITSDNDSLFTVMFNTNGPDDLFYYWEFSNGITSSEVNPFLAFTLEDSIYHLSACLTAYNAAQCTTRMCETLVIALDGDGLIDGTITNADGLIGDRDAGIYRGSTGDPLPNVSILLLDVNGNVLNETFTNADGYYRFDNLFFGDYYVQVNIPGIPHEPYQVTLLPEQPTSADLDFNVSEDIVLGDEELFSNTNFDLFPNPTQTEMTLQFELEKQSDLEITISNILGQEIQKHHYTLSAGAQSISLNTNDLAPNLYLLQIRNGTDTFTKKIIKQ